MAETTTMVSSPESAPEEEAAEETWPEEKAKAEEVEEETGSSPAV